ncbi:winged helix-turn-helix domain-containing protein [Shewanella algae]|uniref:winged helix-turn-helix domain-containing protein n=1 Tax=Shewanella algae TaxID=38313 RepID=UPI0011838EB3|nr:winged helix-turn-helix domain-containing protein [Shewanella algae]MBO2568600.1 winged helix-turn-helix domain-containing protein [Shewanella algae]MBO2678438.1 winged helix-turn-helix domain-containing protein [Shewanella algae]TVL05266.1 hypothetical protein AYI84_04540 [Shewanella algae]BCV29227.1 phage protein [Shewanella algae]
MANDTERAWAWIHSQYSFTRAELAKATGLAPKRCSSIISALKKRGFIKDTALPTGERFIGGFTPKRYKSVNRAEYRGRGKSTAPKHRRGTAQQCVWQSMRIMRTFTYPDLVATAEVSMSTARVYCNLLAQFGYVRQVRGRPNHLPNSQRVGEYASFRLVKDTGPIAPKRQKGGLFDANLNKEIQHDVA